MSELYSRAVRLLARREHTRAELARKLAPHGTEEEIDTVLNELARTGLQSDTRFAESYLRSQAGRLGGRTFAPNTAAKGVCAELVQTQVEDLPDELARARGVWQKKFAAAPADAKEWAKQARFLQGRGFSSEIIRKLLKETETGEIDA